MDLSFFFKFGAVLFNGLYCGCAFYSSLVEHPARLSSGTVVGVTMFKKAYNSSSLLTNILTVFGTACNIYLHYKTKNVLWLVSGISLALTIPISFLLIKPFDKVLYDDKALDGIDKDGEKNAMVSGTLNYWGTLNSFRTIMGLVSFAIPIFLVVKNN